MMTLEQLKLLRAVAEAGSLSKASDQLFKTQSAISQGIKQLESQLDVQLFARDSYRLTLTSAGLLVDSHAKNMLSEATEITQLSKHLSSGNEAIITLAIEAAYDLNRIIPILEKTQSEFPRTQIILKVEYLSGAFEAVQNRNAEIAISPMHQLSLESTEIEASYLHRGYLINVAAPRLLLRHPNLHKAKELKGEYQIVVQDSGVSSKGINYSVQSGQRCWYANDFSTKKTLIKSGMGWGRLPENIIEKELSLGSLSEIKLTDMKSRLGLDYHVVRLRNRPLGPVANKLWKNLLTATQP